jgi:dihydrofolate synthase/folylpolyglutamate synthase
MTYIEAVQYLFSQLPMFHRIGDAAYKANLDNALFLDKYFGYPHKNYSTIHVAGTNGKGSVSHMLAAILQTAGYKTGLFTSPHLKDFRERIRIDGEMIPETEIVQFVEKHKDTFTELKPSFFEMTSALAFDYFNRKKVDIAVIEVGMGGRLDSTNVITPILSVITNIGFDHTQFLGDTLEKIAKEKAGIIKNEIPVVIGEVLPETRPVFVEVSDTLKSLVLFAEERYKTEYSVFTSDRKQVFNIEQNKKLVYEKLKLDLGGFYQRKNICTVLSAIEQLQKNGLRVTKDNIYEGLLNVTKITGLRGRWQELGYNPLIVCDTGHNAHGIKLVAEQLRSIPNKKLHIVIGFVKEKDVRKILELLPKHAAYYFTQADIPRALPVEDLKKVAIEYGLEGETYTTVKDAYRAACDRAEKEDVVFVGGSTFVVAEILEN